MGTTTRLRRILGWSAGILGLATVLTIAIHLGPVRKALGWKPLGIASATGGTNSGWCPFGFGSTGTVAAGPRAPHDPGEPRAHARPALGFALDATTQADVRTWATAHGVACTAGAGGQTLECKDVPAAALPSGEPALALSTAWFAFAADGKLLSIRALRQVADPVAASAAFAHVADAVTAQAGAPTERGGATGVTELASGTLAQAHVEYRFGDYAATVRATNMGPRGYMLTELYATVL